MNNSKIWGRIQGKYQRTLNDIFFRRPLNMHNNSPYISFTFDDFPRSALHTGGNILLKYGVQGTYYASLGLMGSVTPTGEIFVLNDIKDLLSQGHELGCHTFSHCNSFTTATTEFINSILHNKTRLDELIPGATFQTFSYPIEGPRILTKRKIGKYFECCRFGGQTINSGVIDLNFLKAFFLEKTRDAPNIVKGLIDRCCRAHGWLIFATHDIAKSPSRFGCVPSFFEDIVKYSKDSGAIILPVSRALDQIRRQALN